MRQVARRIENEEALDKVSARVQRILDSILKRAPERDRLLDFLHGTWLGHPLHPLLVSLPIGAWTTAVALDFLHPRGGRSRAAEAAIAIGLVGAVAAAPAGWADWKDLNDKQRRLGVVHGLINGGMIATFGLSLLCRIVGFGPARLLSLMGMGGVAAAAYLGGDMVFRLRAGVAHTPIEEPPARAKLSPEDSELADGEMKRIDIEGFPVFVARVDGHHYALGDVCPHLGCSLSEGKLLADRVVCGCHGSEFALEDGRVLAGPATAPVQAFNVTRARGAYTVKPIA